MRQDPVEFGEPGCFCDTWEAHQWINRNYESTKTKNLARKNVPWYQPGEFMCARTMDDPDPTEINRLSNYDISGAIASFYLLDLVIFDLAVEFPMQRQVKQAYAPEVHHGVLQSLLDAGISLRKDTEYDLRRLSAEAQVLKHTIATGAAKHLRNYLHYAIACELRYHSMMGYTLDATAPKRVYWGWNKIVKKFGGEQAALWAAEMFRDKQVNGKPAWDGYYGGESWAQIADVLAWYERGFIHSAERGPRRKDEWWHPEYHRGEFSAYEFVDRVASLQHNTGTCLSKVHWRNGTDMMWFILNSHHYSITRGLYDNAIPDAMDIFERYWYAKNGLSGTKLEIPRLRNCVLCEQADHERLEWACNDKAEPYCKAHIADLCKNHSCSNLRVYGGSHCKRCVKLLFNGIPAMYVKHARGDTSATINHPSSTHQLTVCMSDESCLCSHPTITIHDGKVWIDEYYLQGV